ncbi:MAG: hypothetical protein WCA79_15995 [Anaerolineales bacterium]
MATQLLLPEDQERYSVSLRSQMILSLAGFRQEWEEAVQEESLINVQAPVGLLLADVLERLNLNEQEKFAVMGVRLCREVETLLSDQKKDLQ